MKEKKKKRERKQSKQKTIKGFIYYLISIFFFFAPSLSLCSLKCFLFKLFTEVEERFKINFIIKMRCLE